MTVRLFVAAPLREGTELALPHGAARHAQVRRVQPGDALRLFDGGGCDWPATVLAVGRSEVRVQVGTPVAAAGEPRWPLTIALGMPANERMDAVVEKATELGVAAIQPLLTERSVLRLAGERAQRKVAHWQAVAEAACEQCGRARVPQVAPVRPLAEWLAAL
ncbi:MAG: 16S rRNA (uracil(1498)-N(3))-methyltransferase, partial [Burkholderiales bacterium]|nr:16S rRNA (uracil(1498)-N(3))-methyltransferase [Burkholderiales bacterium]